MNGEPATGNTMPNRSTSTCQVMPGRAPILSLVLSSRAEPSLSVLPRIGNTTSWYLIGTTTSMCLSWDKEFSSLTDECVDRVRQNYKEYSFTDFV